jgi:hypothetical protein
MPWMIFMKNITTIIFLLFMTFGMYGQNQGQTLLVPPIEPIRPILDILKESKVPGSLEFYGKCESFVYPGFPDFPPMVAGSSTIGSPVQRIRLIFSKDPSMQVMQAPDGSIDMVEDNIPQDILNIKISDINFGGANGSGVYSPNLAVQFVLYSPEVRKFVMLHSISFPFYGGPVSFTPGPPNPARPHISSEFHDVTVRFLLNQIAKTFQNLWIYENCPTSAKGTRVVYMRFYQP